MVRDMTERPTHLQELDPFTPTWVRVTHNSGMGMGEICRYLEDQWFVWCYPFTQETKDRLVSDTKLKSNVKTNDLELAALLDQI